MTHKEEYGVFVHVWHSAFIKQVTEDRKRGRERKDAHMWRCDVQLQLTKQEHIKF